MKPFNTPVVLIIYKRPDHTKQLISQLRIVKPTKIYIIADGPKSKNDINAINNTRLVIDQINWKCKIQKNYSSKNMGLKNRMTTGLNWVFKQVKTAIIFEDDCIPNPSFLYFCEELLQRFKFDKRIMSITGNNFDRLKINSNSYYFSQFTHCWGWATWSRAWMLYEGNMASWQSFKKSDLLKRPHNQPLSKWYWNIIFNLTHSGVIGTWDYQWLYSHWVNHGLAIVPSVNLVKNIGYQIDTASHTKRKSKFMDVDTKDIKFPLKHPTSVTINYQSDANLEKTMYLNPITFLGAIYYVFKFITLKINRNVR